MSLSAAFHQTNHACSSSCLNIYGVGTETVAKPAKGRFRLLKIIGARKKGAAALSDLSEIEEQHEEEVQGLVVFLQRKCSRLFRTSCTLARLAKLLRVQRLQVFSCGLRDTAQPPCHTRPQFTSHTPFVWAMKHVLAFLMD